MLKVVGCFVDKHDASLIAVAALICCIATTTAVQLVRLARDSASNVRSLWLLVAALSSGSGIFATHFIGMLAFEPGIPSAYDPKLTLLSLLFSLALTGSGLTVALRTTKSAPWLGGVLLGIGIAAMHYTGMSAYNVEGHLVWDHRLIYVSLAAGMIFAGAALKISLEWTSTLSGLLGGLLLTIAICAHHFTGMAAVTIALDPNIALPTTSISSAGLANVVAMASLIVLLPTAAVVILRLRDQVCLAQETKRMRQLADATVEGLLICRDGLIVTANTSFSRLVGGEIAHLTGQAIDRFLPDRSILDGGDSCDERPTETDMLDAAGRSIDVEVIVQTIDYGGTPHRLIAVRDVRERKRVELQIRHIALHDPLTGLPNRILFHDRLDQALALTRRTRHCFAVLACDLDRFKAINDSLGHPAGDALLRVVAMRMQAVLRPYDTVARLGGDEFAIVVPHLDEPHSVACIAERIITAVSAPVDLDGYSVEVGVSIGLTVATGGDVGANELFKRADIALYEAKAAGRNTYREFCADAGARIATRGQLGLDMKDAIRRGEFRLVYQPVVVAETGVVVGFEALMRWRHPTRGEISPGVFIPVAEETGLIVPLGAWALQEACREAMNWPAHVRVAVNVSAVQLRRDGLEDAVLTTLAASGLPADRLKLEVTESVLMQDADAALARLRRLRSLGVLIALDDFGTGYSSLSYLRRFPFDKLKIDRAFIRDIADPDAAAIVRAVVDIGDRLGMGIVAEGVETAEQLDLVRQEGCHEVQGFLFSKPLPADEALAYLQLPRALVAA